MMKEDIPMKSSALRSNSSGSDTTMNNRFSVFDFTNEDESIEAHDQRIVAKFHSNTNDKYNFLTCFANGSKAQQNDYGSKPLVTNVVGDRSIQLDDILSATSPDHLDFKYHSHCARSYSLRARKPGDSLTDKKHTGSNSTLPQSLTDVKVLDVESDDDQRIGLVSSSSIALIENEGSLEEQPFEYGVDTSEIEIMVVVTPNYVKFGNTYYTKCSLTFSCRRIKLEGSPPWKTKGPCCHEWPISNIVDIEHELCESVKVAVVTFNLISNEANTAEISNKTAGIVPLEFVVSNDTHWSEKLEAIKSLDMRYKTSWNTLFSGYSSNEPFEELIYPDGDPDAISICSRDVELLQPKTFINDTIIDFYIKYLANKTNPEEQHRFYFFNTFFFQKLAYLDRDSSRTWEAREAFQRVRKWTRNVNIFEKDYIFVPVNSSFHWSLIVICHPGEVENLRDGEMGELYRIPCILHMDSIKGSHTGLQNLIQGYLWEEWRDRHSELTEDISAKFFNLQFVSLELPQQENLFDCGLFLLHYAELFLEQVPSNFSLRTLNKCPDFLRKNWFLPDEVSLRKRDHIRKLIYKIVRDIAKIDVPSANNDNCLSRAPIGTIIRGQQTFRESKFVCVDSMGPSTPHMVLMEQSSNPMSPIEDAIEEQVASSPEDEASSHEADEDAKSLTVLSSPSSFRVVEKKFSLENSRICGEDEASSHEADEDAKSLTVLSSPSSLRVVEKKFSLENSRICGEDEASSHEADEDTNSLTILSSPSGLRVVEKFSLETSRNSVGTFRIIIDEETEEDCVPEVAFNSEIEDNSEYSTMSFPEIAECIVEDSEDENERQDISNTWNPPCKDKSPASCYRKAESTNRSNHRMNHIQFISAAEENRSAKKPRSSSRLEGQREITIL